LFEEIKFLLVLLLGDLKLRMSISSFRPLQQDRLWDEWIA